MQLYLVYTHGRSWLGGKIFGLEKLASGKLILIELDNTPECIVIIDVSQHGLAKFTEIDIHHPACVEYIKGKKKNQPVRFYDPIDSARMREDFKSFLLKQERIRFIGTLVIPAALLIVILIIWVWHYVK